MPFIADNITSKVNQISHYYFHFLPIIIIGKMRNPEQLITGITRIRIIGYITA